MTRRFGGESNIGGHIEPTFEPQLNELKGIASRITAAEKASEQQKVKLEKKTGKLAESLLAMGVTPEIIHNATEQHYLTVIESEVIEAVAEGYSFDKIVNLYPRLNAPTNVRNYYNTGIKKLAENYPDKVKLPEKE